MVLQLKDFGLDAPGFQAFKPSGLLSADSAAAQDFDPAGERQDLSRFGFQAGYNSYFQASSQPASDGVWFAGSGVLVFASGQAAAGYFADNRQEIKDQAGKTSAQGVTEGEVSYFKTSAGDESLGAHWTATTSQAEYTVSIVALRRGRVFANISLYRPQLTSETKAATERQLAALAEKIDKQIREAGASN